MPNDCWNLITIICDYPEGQDYINSLIMNKLQEKIGDKYFYYDNIEVITCGKKAIIFKLRSTGLPNYTWYENILTDYPTCWIKNEWWEEGGYAGVWVGHVDSNNKSIIQSLLWPDITIEGRTFLFIDETDEI